MPAFRILTSRHVAECSAPANKCSSRKPVLPIENPSLRIKNPNIRIANPDDPLINLTSKETNCFLLECLRCSGKTSQTPMHDTMKSLPRVLNFPPATTTGEWWKDQIICGDSKAILHAMPDESVHLAITSPPYNVGLQYDSHNDKMPYEEY